MGFKLKGAPYDKNDMNIGVYKQNLTDGSVGKSNHTGIIVQNGIDPLTEKAVIAHEKVHQIQQQKGELDYDDNNFYWKGKTYPRENLDEHNENLPWEKEAYKESNKQIKDQNKEMGSNKFKLKGHRGNNSPFKHLMERGLIGPTLKSGSSMNPGFDKLPKAVQNKILKKDGASMMERYGPAKKDPTGAGSNFSKKEQRRLKKSVKCTKGVDGGEYCTQKTNNKDNSSTKKTKDGSKKKNYLVEDRVNKTTSKNAVDIRATDGGTMQKKDVSFGLGKASMEKFDKYVATMDENKAIDKKNKSGKGQLRTTKARKENKNRVNADKKEIAANEAKVKKKFLNSGQNSRKKFKDSASKVFDKNYEGGENNQVGSEKTLSKYKKATKKKNQSANTKGRDFAKDKFKKSVTTRRGSDTGKVGDSLDPNAKKAKGRTQLTGTAKTKNRLLKKGTKTKSFKLEGTEGSGKAVGENKLDRKNKRFTRQVTGGRNTMGADKETKSSRTENRKMEYRKKANKRSAADKIKAGVTGNPEVTKSKTSKFNKVRKEVASAKRKKKVSSMLR